MLVKKNNPIFISLVCNILLMLGKGITGLLANSNALVADAMHSLSDVSVFFMNYRACKNCEMYGRIDRKGTSKKISQRIVNTELYATYYTGILFFMVGITICLHNFMILVLNKVEKPDFITFVVAFISLVVYAGLYKYLERGTDDTEDCVLTSRNTHWQNKMNLFSGSVVLIGLTGAMLGFIFMDELAAVVVGSIVFSMGFKLIMEAKGYFSASMKRYFKPVVISSILISIVLAIISLSIQLR